MPYTSIYAKSPSPPRLSGTTTPTAKIQRPFKYVKLADCDTNHLEATLNTQKQISDTYRGTIECILKERYQIHKREVTV